MPKRSALLAAWFCCALFAVAARAELRKDIECDLITVEGAKHGMTIITKYPDTQVKMIAWLKTTLKLK